jgi:L-2-hydroxyglutarate oxidase
MEYYDVVIAGAGMVGLATAFELSQKGNSVLVLEKESGPAKHQSGRNSGVVHSGVYYKPGSLKAKNCIEGRSALLEFCEKESIPTRKLHKLIVATDKKELPRLQDIYQRGLGNKISNLRILSAEETLEWEPNVFSIQSLLIENCHIVDYRQVANSLCKKVPVRFNEAVISYGREVVTTKNVYRYKTFINCAGLHSDRLAKIAPHKILPFRGEYYLLTKVRTTGLIYPVPDPNFPFLGVHLTPMINGRVEAGPNAVLAFAREGYRKTDFNWRDVLDVLKYPGFWKMAGKYWKAGCYEMARSLSKTLFLKDLRRLVPTMEISDLEPGSSGVRAQVVTREGKLLDDFSFERKNNVLHVFNAPSPAATASFSIAKTLASMI